MFVATAPNEDKEKLGERKRKQKMRYFFSLLSTHTYHILVIHVYLETVVLTLELLHFPQVHLFVFLKVARKAGGSVQPVQ